MVTTADLLRAPEGTAEVIVRPDGTRLHTITAGDGPVIVLVHGFGIAMNEWSLVMPELVERGHRVIAYDHRGHGKSTVGSDGWTTAALFADLQAVVSHFDLHDAVLVGHSMGTFTVLGALADAGLRARTTAAVLVSTTAGELFKGASLPARMQVPLVRSGILQRVAASPKLGPGVVKPALGPDAAPEVGEAMRLAFAAIPPDSARFLSAMGTESLAPALPSITTPLCLLLGECDTVMPLPRSQVVLDQAPNARLTMVPRAGHLVNWEDPGAIVAAVVDVAQLSTED